MDAIRFTKEGLVDFLNEFNAASFKYFGVNTIPSEFQDDDISFLIEKEVQASKLSSKVAIKNLVDAFKVAEKVYCNQVEAEEYVYIYKTVIEKFVNQFVGIDGIEDLYNALFFVFEWMMHLEYDSDKNSYSYYRDHFIHQVRNMYEMIKMLSDDGLGLYEKCMDIMEKEEDILSAWMKEVVSNEEKVFKETELGNNLCNVIKEDRSKQDFIKKVIYRYIFVASAIVTSLVHDIGYTIRYFDRNLSRLGCFLPISEYFFEKKICASKLNHLLQGSLLYKSTSVAEISKRIDEKDHGAISACTLLMKFYEDGQIYSLPNVKRMIIELSAVAIYEHTLKYEINGEKEHDLYQNVFASNPFSFLFRLCDDMEEWDRVYFDVTKQSNFLVCEECGTIINRLRIVPDKNNKKRMYACCCGIKGKNKNLFTYQKLAYINTCDEVSIEKIMTKHESKKQDGNDEINKVVGYKININYDLIKLLQASAYSSTFAIVRAKTLTKIKKMVIDQDGLCPIYVSSFISNNPIAIKTEILRRYMKGKCSWNNLLNEIGNNDKIEQLGTIIWNFDKSDLMQVRESILELINTSKILKNPDLRDLIHDNMNFYIRLALLVECIYANKKQNVEEKKAKVFMISQSICKKEKIYLTSLKELIGDTIEQAIRSVSVDDFFVNRFAFQESYYNMFNQSEQVMYAAESYIGSELYDYVRYNCTKDSKIKENIQISKEDLDNSKYDFYSDYYIFDRMNERLKQ